jgi:hypothetical protein
MLHDLCNITSMARGPSGRFVIELNAEAKRELHQALAQDGLTLKEWFRSRVRTYLADRLQPGLPGLSSANNGRSSSEDVKR